MLSRKKSSLNFTIPLMTKTDVIDSKTNKATGLDNIRTVSLKIAAPKRAPPIAKMMNISLTSAVFPSKWKIARVTPLFKDGDRENVTN